MKNKLKTRVKKILENKDNNYKRKYFLLSKIAETDIRKSELFETFVCYSKSLNTSNGRFPEEKAIVSLYQQQLFSEAVCKPAIEVCKSKLIKETNLFYTSSITDENDVIKSLLESVSLGNRKINTKLSSILIEAARRKKSILSESEYSEANVVDLTKLFREPALLQEPTPSDIYDIQDEEQEDFEDDIEEEESSYATAAKIDRTVNKIIDIFDPIVGGDPKKMSQKDVAEKLGFKGNGRYVKGQKMPVLSGWNKLEMAIGRMLSPLGRSKGMSTVAQRKWWIIQCIKFCLLIEKQQGYLLGVSSEEKGRLKLSDDQKDAVSSVAGERRRSGQPMSHVEIKNIINQLHVVLMKGDYDLESSLIEEDELLRVLYMSSAKRPHKVKMFKHDLDVMYPISDYRSEDEKVARLSQEEEEMSRSEVGDYFSEKEGEVRSLYSDEIDPETGEPLYADEETISRLKSQVINVDESSSESVDEPITYMSINDYTDHMKKINNILSRLRELDDKMIGVKPDIFYPFDQDDAGNLNYNEIEQIEVPPQSLTTEEISEYENLVSELYKVKKIVLLSLDRRGIIYDEMYERGATPEEFMAFMRSFGLSDGSTPQKYRDISRSSYGKFRDAAGSRQYALKAWFKANYYSLNPKEKAEIYAQLGEKWYERLTVLDLITDEAFEIPSKSKADKKSPKLGAYFDSLPRYLTPKTIERYFNVSGEESLEVEVQEKIQRALMLTDSEESFQEVIKAMQDSDPSAKKYAILDALFEGSSSFRIFATTMLKEFYNKNVWSTLESDLAGAVVEYFKKNYRNAGIGRSFEAGMKAGDIPKEEGQDLFNPIIYLAMSRVGLPKEEAYTSGDDASLEDYQRRYFLGDINNKGDFAQKVRKFNSTLKTGGLYSINSNPMENKMFNRKDVELLLDDIFNPRGIIGKVRDRMRQLTANTSNEFIVFLNDYDESKLDHIIVNAMAMSNVIKRGADPMNVEVYNAVAKDSEEALKKYKKHFAKQLTSPEFTEYLGDEFGYDPVDLKNKTSFKKIPTDML